MRWKWTSRGVAAAMALACSQVGASGLQVAPIGLQFTPARPARGLWLTNTGDTPLRAQVRVFHWTQAEGKDELTPTRALLASPPMLNLAPGARQLVRVIRTGAPARADAAEDAFRVLIDELPQPEQRPASGVAYVLGYSVPVFVEGAAPVPAAAVAAGLHATVEHDANGPVLVVHNAGAHRAQLSKVSLLPPAGEAISVSPGLLGYVLPGMTMRWPLKLKTDSIGAETQLKARINGEPLEQTILVRVLSR